MTTITSSVLALDAGIVGTLGTTSNLAPTAQQVEQSLTSLGSPSSDVNLSQTAVMLSLEQGIVGTIGAASSGPGLYNAAGLLQSLEVPAPSGDQASTGAAQLPLSLDQSIVGTLPG